MERWAFHSVNGWYLATPHEHYQTHKCHVKDTYSDRYSDTVQFQHKTITNPTVSPYNKIMHALSNCAAAIKGIKGIDASQDIQNIQCIAMLPDNEQDDSNNMML